MEPQDTSYIGKFIKDNAMNIVFLIILLVVLYFLYQMKLDNDRLRQELSSKPVVMTSQQATDPNYLRNKLDMEKKDAEKTTVIIENIKKSSRRGYPTPLTPPYMRIRIRRFKTMIRCGYLIAPFEHIDTYPSLLCQHGFRKHFVQ